MGRARKVKLNNSSGVYHKVKKPKLKPFQVSEFNRLTYLKTIQLLQSDEPLTLESSVQRCLHNNDLSISSMKKLDEMSDVKKSKIFSNIELDFKSKYCKVIAPKRNPWQSNSVPFIKKEVIDVETAGCSKENEYINLDTISIISSDNNDTLSSNDDVQSVISYLDNRSSQILDKRQSKIDLLASAYNKLVDEEQTKLNFPIENKLTNRRKRFLQKESTPIPKLKKNRTNVLNTCETCSFSYNNEIPDDIKDHEIHHEEFLKFYWNLKNKWVGNGDTDQFIIKIEPKDKKSWNRLKEILAVITDINITVEDLKKIHFWTGYVVLEKYKVLGFLLVEKAEKAFKLIDSNQNIHSDKEHQVIVSVNNIWVNEKKRRQGIASHLMDTFRIDYLKLKYLTIDLIAIKSPNENGKQFFTKYLKTSNFYVID